MSDAEFTKLVNQYTRLIYTVCYRFLSDHYEAENLTQETFLTAFRVIDDFIGDNYKPWLVRIATNKCKDYLKSSYVKTTAATEDETLNAVESNYDLQSEVESNDMLSIVKIACESLKSPYKEVAILHFLEDKSFEAVSDELDRPLKTVQTQAYRARDKLREILRRELYDGE